MTYRAPLRGNLIIRVCMGAPLTLQHASNGLSCVCLHSGRFNMRATDLTPCLWVGHTLTLASCCQVGLDITTLAGLAPHHWDNDDLR